MAKRSIQKKTIRQMAASSLKSGRIRNIFVMITIMLSVSLLTVIFLFGTGAQEESRKKAAISPHAIFGNLTQEQVMKLRADDRLSYTLEAKMGIPTEMEGYNVIPRYIEEFSKEIQMGKLDEGRLPQKPGEAAVQAEYLHKLGKASKVGESFDITFYDGMTETFTVSGLVSGAKANKNFTLLVSKEYAENSSQLKDIPFEMYAKVQGGASMSKEECKEVVHQIGADAGMEYKNVMPNNSFLDTLSVDWQQVQIAVIVACVILLACVLVVYGVFYISVVGRIHQFGQMRTIGMTRKQIKKFVKMEGRTLFVRAFPLGLIIGGIAGYFIKPGGWNWKNTILVFAAVILINYMVTMLSVIKPAKIAANISPMEALRYTPQDGVKKSNAAKACRNLSALGLGTMNYTKNRKKTVLTMLSLALGGILFMVAATYMVSFDKNLYSRQMSFEKGEFDIQISEAARDLDEHGLSGIQNNNPLNADFEQKVRAIDGVKEIHKMMELGLTFDAEAYDEYGVDDGIYFLEEQEIEEFKATQKGNSLDVNKLMSGDYVLVQGVDVMEEIYGWSLKKGDQITFHYYDGNNMAERVVEVLAVTEKMLNPMQEGWFSIPAEAAEDWTTYSSYDSSWVVSTEADKEEAVGAELEALLAQQPMLTMDTLKERIEIDEENCARMFGAIAGISIFVIMFSVLSMMNTLITNIISRKQELAMLESIGMQKRQIGKMLLSESLLISGVNLCITAVVGTATGWGLCQMLNNAGLKYMVFRFPGELLAVYAVLLIIIPIIITMVSQENFSRESLVERIRGVEC